MIKRLCLLALGVVLLMTPTPAAAQQESGIQVEARAGFDNLIQPGAWVPIQVTASNTGADFAGELRIEAPTLTGSSVAYTRPIDLPQGSRKVVTVYTHPTANLSGEVRVDLMDGNRVALTKTIDVQSVARETVLIGQIGNQSVQGLGGIFTNPTALATAFLTVDDLPDLGIAWEALDVLIISNADTGQLTPDQRSALAGWVAQGGRLIVAAGSGFQATTAGLDDLLPMELNDSTRTDISPIAAAVGISFAQNADNVVATGTLNEGGQVLISNGDDVPLLVYQDYGAGRVDLITADITLSPLANWNGMSSLWRFIFADGAARPDWAYGFSPRWDDARNAVGSLPGVSLPNILQLCGFLGLYVLLIGPVNYFVLWRMKKRELAWVTIPVMVIGFSLVAYLTGFQLRGGQAKVHRLAIVQTYPDTDVARVDGLIGVWSPRRARYDIQMPAGMLAFPVPREIGTGLITPSDVTIESQVQSTTIRDIRVDIGAIAPFAVQGTIQAAPRLDGEITLRLTDEGITLQGDIINESAVDYENVALVFGGSISELRNLPAGEVLRVDTNLSSGVATRAPDSILQAYPANNEGFGPGFGGFQSNALVNSLAGGANCTNFDIDRECALINAILNGEGRGASVYLVAWSDTLPFDTDFLNANAEPEDLVVTIAELGTVIQSVEGAALEIPPGLMTWRPGDNVTLTEQANPYNLYISEGAVYTFRYQPVALVPELNYEALAFTLEPDFDSEGRLPEVELYNNTAQQWDSFPVEEWGTTVVEDADDYIAPGGEVILRITAPFNTYYTIERLDVTLIAR